VAAVAAAAAAAERAIPPALAALVAAAIYTFCGVETMTKTELMARVAALEVDKAELLGANEDLQSVWAELKIDNARLEAEKVALGSVIESQQEQIASFQDMAREYVDLRDEYALLLHQVSELQNQLAAAKGSGQFMDLGRGFIKTAFGQRVLAEPSIDTAPFLLGVIGADYEIIQDTYKFALARFAALGAPASEAELQEIASLLVQTGFAASAV
jgi:chromosome segregation ATPase